MIYECYSVYDSAADVYSMPHQFRSHGEAIRSFESGVADPSTPFHKHAEDFSLFHIGQFDDSTGMNIPLSVPVPLARAHEVKSRLNPSV